MIPLMLKKIGGLATLFLFAGILFAPVTLAQGLFDTLDTIKTTLNKPAACEKIKDKTSDEYKKCVKENKVSVIDFSKSRTWGNLPEETQSILKGLGYLNLDAVIAKADDEQIKGTTYEEFLKELKGLTYESGDALGNLNDHGKLVLGEIKYQGESQLQAIILAVAKVFRNLMGALGMIFIVIAGLQMIFAQGEEAKITEQKNAITYALIGLVIILIIERIINAVYGVPGEMRSLTPETASKVDLEIYGLISYMKAILGSVAIFMIILSGMKTIFAQGDEAEITNQRKAILWTIVGLALILINKVVVQNLFISPTRLQKGQITQGNIQKILTLFGEGLQFLLGFVGLFALAALVYGAGSMVANFGNEEAVAKAKKITTNAIVGIIIILSAFTIVTTVIL